MRVLANSRDRQAVRIPSLGLTAATFWAPGRAGPLTVTTPAAVLVRVHGRTATVLLAEPPRTGVPLDLTWDRPVRRVTAHDPSVRVLSAGDKLRLRVTPGTVCAPHRCTVTLGDRE
ncbi:polysaccharide lyase beta-sandwich domain-containing protein [Streptomyces stramineus]